MTSCPSEKITLFIYHPYKEVKFTRFYTQTYTATIIFCTILYRATTYTPISPERRTSICLWHVPQQVFFLMLLWQKSVMYYWCVSISSTTFWSVQKCLRSQITGRVHCASSTCYYYSYYYYKRGVKHWVLCCYWKILNHWSRATGTTLMLIIFLQMHLNSSAIFHLLINFNSSHFVERLQNKLFSHIVCYSSYKQPFSHQLLILLGFI